MDILYEACAGLDVHKASISACVLRFDSGRKVVGVVREFGTMTADILNLGDWMAAQQVKQVAMESTGVYWKPIWNLLEDQFNLILCNPQEVKNVPGRKTDTRDCQWLAQLLQHGLLRSSFIPPRPQRELRDLTRHRAQLVGEHTRTGNRVAKVLEDANIKLSSVATDILGKSGRLMIKAIITGEDDPHKLADLAQRRLRKKLPELQQALRGGASEHHRFMLRQLFEHLEHLERAISEVEMRVDLHMPSEALNQAPAENSALHFDQAVELLATIPGIDKRTAQDVLVEIGTDMKQFPTSAHLASWAGLCPGNNESAGKRKSGRTTCGNRWLKRTLSQAAWAASHTKNTRLSEKFRRIARRRGKKRAIVALSHNLLTIAYHILQNNIPYKELGADYYETADPKRRERYYTKQLQKLGFNVILEKSEEAA